MSCLGLWLECDRGMLRIHLNTRETDGATGGRPPRKGATTFIHMFVVLQIKSTNFVLLYFYSLVVCIFLFFHNWRQMVLRK